MNKEKLKGYLEKVKTTLGKVSKKIWILIGVALAVIVAAVIIYINTRPYATLIAGANSEEMGSVLTWLQEQGVTDYRVQGSGTIVVPEGQAASLKARLLQQQYSSANSSFSGYFERVGALSTMVDRERAWLVALEEEMEKTIRQFPGVRSVDVQINPGEDRSYVLDSNNVVDATASVVLTMEEGKLLTNEQANAIRNYVSHGVAGLKVEDVDLSDTWGNSYADLSAGGNAASDSALKIQLEQYYNNLFRTQIMQQLGKTYGEDNVIVNVRSEVELGNKTIVDYDVHLLEQFIDENGQSDGRGILGSEIIGWQFLTDDEYATGGVVGTASNAQLPTYVEPGEAAAELQGILKENSERYYDNPKTQTTMIVHCGTLKDVSVSISIDARAARVDADRVRRTAASSVGLVPVATDDMTADEWIEWKIAVLNDEWVRPAPEEPTTKPGFIFGIPLWAIIALGAGMVLFVVLLVVILLVRSKKRKKAAEEQKAVEELLAVAMPQQNEDGVQVDEEGNPVSGANVMDLHTERSMELRQNIRDYVDENMEVAALLIKSWLKEDGDNA